MGHVIQHIWISFYFRYMKNGNHVYRPITRDEIGQLRTFLTSHYTISNVIIYDAKRKPYRNAQCTRLSGIAFDFDPPITITYTEEYKTIFLPINDFLLHLGYGHGIYNMMGRNDQQMPWQMDGRHIHLD